MANWDGHILSYHAGLLPLASYRISCDKIQPSPFDSIVQIEERHAARMSPNNAAFSWDTFENFSQNSILFKISTYNHKTKNISLKTILNMRKFDKVWKILAMIEVWDILEMDEDSLKPKSIELYRFFHQSKIMMTKIVMLVTFSQCWRQKGFTSASSFNSIKSISHKRLLCKINSKRYLGFVFGTSTLPFQYFKGELSSVFCQWIVTFWITSNFNQFRWRLSSVFWLVQLSANRI